jgi:hypothetical protein
LCCPGAPRLPGRDAVQFDVLTGSANPVFKQLRDLHFDTGNSIGVENVDATIIDRVDSADRRTPGHREIAPVWEMVRSKIRADGVYPPSFFILLAIAGLIGAAGGWHTYGVTQRPNGARSRAPQATPGQSPARCGTSGARDRPGAASRAASTPRSR